MLSEPRDALAAADCHDAERAVHGRQGKYRDERSVPEIRYPGKKFAYADLEELEQDIKPTGFYHNKARNIIACARRLVQEFGGEVPQSLEDLTSLAGVGRKTANVIRGNIYHEPSIVVDTHVKRISRKLGLTKEEDPEKIEYDLMKVLPKTTGFYIIYRLSPLAEPSVSRETQNAKSAF